MIEACRELGSSAIEITHPLIGDFEHELVDQHSNVVSLGTPVLGVQALGPSQQLPQGGDIGREPGEAMCCELVAIEGTRIDLAGDDHPRANRTPRRIGDALGSIERRPALSQQIGQER